MIARRLSAYREAKGLVPEEQRGFPPNRSTPDMMFVARRLQEIGRKAGVSLFMCFIDLQKAYDTVDRNPPVAGTHSHRRPAWILPKHQIRAAGEDGESLIIVRP